MLVSATAGGKESNFLQMRGLVATSLIAAHFERSREFYRKLLMTAALHRGLPLPIACGMIAPNRLKPASQCGRSKGEA
jgi:hypothetical protein